MTSLQTGLKQIPANNGYYINVAPCVTTIYANTGSDAAPAFNNTIAISSIASATGASTIVAVAGAAIFRDMGKTLLSSTRVFRKVQLLVSTNSLVNGGTDGVGGNANNSIFTNYLTMYIELPGTGGYSSGAGLNAGAADFTPVARLG